MTSRARTLIIAAIAGLLAGIFRDQQALSVLSLSVLLWVFGTWCSLMVSARLRWPIVTCVRSLNGRTDRQRVLWADRRIVVEVTIESTRGAIPSLTTFRDILPDTVEPVSGESQITVYGDSEMVVLAYECGIRSAGRVTFPGIHVRMTDPAGLFSVDRFIREDASFRVYPSFSAVGDMRPGVKRINSLPQHGVHRLQRSGFGSELLELREYQPGDPPKAIAWKVSARRDRLMTRQYESEVPVRVTLFVDGYVNARAAGFGRRLLDQTVSTAASVARASVSIGDPIAAVLLDERGAQRIRSATGDRAFYRLLEALSEFAGQTKLPELSLTPILLSRAVAVCRERFPELMDESVNQPPFTWLPMRPKTRRLRHERTLLANALAELYDLSAMAVIHLVHDDRRMGRMCCRFLQDAGLAWVVLPPAATAARNNSPDRRLTTIARELTAAVARARDNEVFVVLADLIGCADRLHDVLPAVKVALGRHHRVVFISPSPTGRRPTDELPVSPVTSAADVFRRADEIHAAEVASRVRRQLRRIGATVGFSGAKNATAIVMAEAELAGNGRSVAGRSK